MVWSYITLLYKWENYSVEKVHAVLKDVRAPRCARALWIPPDISATTVIIIVTQRQHLYSTCLCSRIPKIAHVIPSCSWTCRAPQGVFLLILSIKHVDDKLFFSRILRRHRAISWHYRLHALFCYIPFCTHRHSVFFYLNKHLILDITICSTC